MIRTKKKLGNLIAYRIVMYNRGTEWSYCCKGK